MSYSSAICRPNTCDLATSTQSRETRQTQSCCCNFQKCRSPLQCNSGNRTISFAVSEYCDDKTCGYHLTNLADGPQSRVLKKSLGLRKTPHPVSQRIRNPKFYRTTSLPLSNREIQTDKKSTKVICGRPGSCIQTNIHKLYNSEKKFSEACDVVFAKCIILENASLGKVQNCRNRIIYCTSPSVFNNKTVFPQSAPLKKNQFTSYGIDETQSKNIRGNTPCKLEFCTQQHPASIKTQKNIIDNHSPSPEGNITIGEKDQESRSTPAKIVENTPIIEIAGEEELKMEANLPDCCKNKVDGQNPNIAVSDCCEGPDLDSYTQYDETLSAIYVPRKTSSWCEINTLNIPNCCNPKQTLQKTPQDKSRDLNKNTSTVSEIIEEDLGSNFSNEASPQVIPDSFVEEYQSQEVSSPKIPDNNKGQNKSPVISDNPINNLKNYTNESSSKPSLEKKEQGKYKETVEDIPSTSKMRKKEVYSDYNNEPSKQKITNSAIAANPSKEVSPPKVLSCCIFNENNINKTNKEQLNDESAEKSSSPEPSKKTILDKTSKIDCCKGESMQNSKGKMQDKNKKPDEDEYSTSHKVKDSLIPNYNDMPSEQKNPSLGTKPNENKAVSASKTFSCCEDIELADNCQVNNDNSGPNKSSPVSTSNMLMHESPKTDEAHFQSTPEPSKRPYCEPTNCEKLNMTVPSNYCDPTNCEKLNITNKKWKICCDKSKCPINDPTTSTYQFLLKTRLCCNRKACQLAAKICDIYEPLVNVGMDIGPSENFGEDMYHYLGTDAYTSYDADHAEREEADTIETHSTIMIELPEDDFVRESVYIDPEEAPKKERRASTVSWVVPGETDPTLASENDLSVSVSTEQIIAQATAAANKFRQSPQGTKHATLLGDIVKKRSDPRKDPKELSHQTLQSQDLLFKSQLDNINLASSKHKTNCCSSLKKKFRRKKKSRTDKYEDEFGDTENYSNWQSSFESERKRPKLDPVAEKKQQINNMLNSM